jgi:hypothetical protein
VDRRFIPNSDLNVQVSIGTRIEIPFCHAFFSSGNAHISLAAGEGAVDAFGRHTTSIPADLTPDFHTKLQPTPAHIMPGSSIQSYFTSSPTKIGDGFTVEEMQAALHPHSAPSSAQWTVSDGPNLITTTSNLPIANARLRRSRSWQSRARAP